MADRSSQADFPAVPPNPFVPPPPQPGGTQQIDKGPDGPDLSKVEENDWRG
jgi:hypothetical protein